MSPGISTRLLATQSDERLIALIREGHERAFEALVHRYRKPLLSYCRRLPLPEARAEDVLQQSLLKAWLALRDGAEVRNVKAWLYRVVHNTALNSARDNARDRDQLAEDALARVSSGEGLERGLVLRETLAEVAALPALQREVIVRTAVAGDSHERVASDLGITDGAVRGLLYRARATLRTAVTALTPPPLLNLLAGGASGGGPSSERLLELTAGGGTAGLAGLALKGGIAVIAAGTVITGATVVHLQGRPQRYPPRTVAVAPAPTTTEAGAAATELAAARTSPAGGALVRASHERSRRAPGSRTAHRPGGAAPLATIRWQRPRAGERVAAGNAPRSLRSTPGGSGESGDGAGGYRPAGTPTVTVTTTTPAASGGAGQTTTPAQGAAGGGAGNDGAAGPDGGPVGQAAGNSGGAGGAQTPDAGQSDQSPGGSETPGGGDASGSDEREAGAGSGAGGAGGNAPEGGGGGIVGGIVHEVGKLVGHLLH